MYIFIDLCVYICASIRHAVTNANRLRGDEELSVSEASTISKLTDWEVTDWNKYPSLSARIRLPVSK